MENFENEQFRQEPEIQENTNHHENQEQPAREEYRPEPEQQTYRGAGVGRKESPFANSPYVTNQPHVKPEGEPYRYQNAYVPPVPPQEPPRKPKKLKKADGGKVWKVVLCAVLAIALVAGSCGITAAVVNNNWKNRMDRYQDSVDSRFAQMQEQIDALPDQNNIVGYPNMVTTITPPGAIYQNNVEAVVLISAKVTSASMFGQTTGVSTGSGFVLTEDGYVVTNHHVVEGASGVTVTMYDGTEYEAEIVGTDETNDVAVLKITETVQLQAVTIGSSDALNVGDQVVAIGNPLGELTSTLTVGYVSAKGRDVTTDGKTINMIQTDAAINSGNSGGPLFNSQGEVVGITTAKYSGSSASGATIEGIGFAIPIDDVVPLVDDLINYGYINSAYLGVMVSEMDASTASYYGLPVGAYVQEVTAGNCAEKAGLKAKDIIVGLGDYKIKSVSDLTKALRKFKAGDTTTITVFRSGQELSMSITLDEKPRETETEIPVPSGGNLPENGSYEDWYNYFFGPQN